MKTIKGSLSSISNSEFPRTNMRADRETGEVSNPSPGLLKKEGNIQNKIKILSRVER
jgi:hypothetical protein